MPLHEAVQAALRDLPPVIIDDMLRARVLSLLDLTSLHTDDTLTSLQAFAAKAISPQGHVAAVCVLPQVAKGMVDQFAGTKVHVATVANFPEGRSSLETVLVEINTALAAGVQEVDVVMPYARWLAGEQEAVASFVAGIRAACGANVCLKMILETGVLATIDQIASASRMCYMAGADFVKTSTGKVAEGASLEAAATMLLVAREVSGKLTRKAGVKVSGGIRHLTQAAEYVLLADQIMGKDKVTAETFRIGASQLVDALIT